MDDQDLVSVVSVQNATEAEIIRGTLQSAGIACHIGGETQAGLAGVLSIDVLVHASDVKQARKLLREARNARHERRKKKAAAKKAKADDAKSEGIQELKPDSHFKKKQN